MTEQEFKAAFIKCFGEQFLPRLTTVVDTMGDAITHMTALERRVAALEAQLSTRALEKSIENMASSIAQELKPAIDRVLRVAEETFRRNAELIDGRTLQ